MVDSGIPLPDFKELKLSMNLVRQLNDCPKTGNVYEDTEALENIMKLATSVKL